MKTYYLAILAVALFFMSCGNPARDKKIPEPETIAELTADSTRQYRVDPSRSEIRWKSHFHSGNHTGAVAVKNGEITVDEYGITGGSLILDMNNITNTDLRDQGDNSAFLDYVQSSAYLDATNYPEGSFTISHADKHQDDDFVSYTLGGSLNIKGIRQNVLFDVKTRQEGGNWIIESFPFRVSPSDWGIRYDARSNPEEYANNAVNDSIEIQFYIVAQK